jgi:hypothetical protein
VSREEAADGEGRLDRASGRVLTGKWRRRAQNRAGRNEGAGSKPAGAMGSGPSSRRPTRLRAMSAGLHATGSSNPETSDSGRASATSLLAVVSNLVRWHRRKTFLVRHFGGQSRQGRQAAQSEQIPFSAVIIQLQRRFRLRRRGHAHRSLIGPVVVPQECRRDWWARRSCEPARLPFAPHSDPRRAAPDQNPLLVLRF